MPRTTRSRLAATALACAAALVAVPQASADSISYIKDGNVWLSTPDGARQVQVTTGGGYTYASQADDGTLVALVGQRLQKLSRSGQVLADFATPVTDPRTDGKQFFGPFDPVVSPDGTRVAYGYYYQSYGFDPTCNYPVGCIREQLHVGTGLTASDRITSWDEPGWAHQTGWQHPAWIDNSTLMLSEPGAALNEDVILDVAGDGYQTITRWFADTSIHGLRDGEMTRQHTKLAFVGGENDANLRIYRMTGEPTALPEACYEWSNPKGAFASPTWSPDGARLAFAQADGVYVAAVPDLGAACAIGTDAGTLTIPGASAPDWGPADVPAKGTVTPAAAAAAPRRAGRRRWRRHGDARCRRPVRPRRQGRGPARLAAGRDPEEGPRRARVGVRRRAGRGHGLAAEGARQAAAPARRDRPQGGGRHLRRHGHPRPAVGRRQAQAPRPRRRLLRRQGDRRRQAVRDPDHPRRALTSASHRARPQRTAAPGVRGPVRQGQPMRTRTTATSLPLTRSSQRQRPGLQRAGAHADDRADALRVRLRDGGQGPAVGQEPAGDDAPLAFGCTVKTKVAWHLRPLAGQAQRRRPVAHRARERLAARCPPAARQRRAHLGRHQRHRAGRPDGADDELAGQRACRAP